MARFFEDFWVGERFTSPGRRITDGDLDAFTALSGDRNPIHVDAAFAATTPYGRRVMHGPFGISAVLGLHHEMGLVDGTTVGMLDAHWNFLAPMFPGDTIHFEMTITRCRRSSSGVNGVINRYVKILNQQDEVLQEGTSALLVKCRDCKPAHAESHRRDFASISWAQQIGGLLAKNEAFRSGTAAFDGTIGLQAGNEGCQIRIYKGLILEAAARTPLGPSFTIEAAEIDWVELALSERNDFVARTMSGRFRAVGNTYEYLRLTKAVTALIDCVQALAQGEERS